MASKKQKKLGKRKFLFTLANGGHDVPVYEVKGLYRHHSLAGRFMIKEHCIEMSDELTPDEWMETLIHESIHACEWIQNFKLTERQVHTLGFGLHSMLKGFIQR